MPSNSRYFREGLVAGAAVVAVWFLLCALAAGMLLRTPALFGATLFHGLRGPSALVITRPLVLQYTTVHGLAFITLGWAAADSWRWPIANEDLLSIGRIDADYVEITPSAAGVPIPK